ncbi:MAG: DUF2117 domain-containing protein [Elusimicrobiales bacterium]|nr:DUF2117 domain-containing protein [Elusimicrobiales bacterium]
MIGILFHGPEVFDSGWALRLINAFPDGRFMLAGTMSRTALFDSKIKNVESPGEQPSKCLKILASSCSSVLIATKGKDQISGLVFGRMVANRSSVDIPVIFAECSGPVYGILSGFCPSTISTSLQNLGFNEVSVPEVEMNIFKEGNLLCRRMTTAKKDEFVLVNGIVIGRSLGREIVFYTDGRSIKQVHGVKIKKHGLEKLERLGGVDIKTAKLASTSMLRKQRILVRQEHSFGKGVVFIDHAGMYIYELAANSAGAVTVGDDTTAIAGDILRRFNIPVIGITDGDGDGLHKGGFAIGSVVLRVKADDKEGLRVLKKIFCGRKRTTAPFNEVKKKVLNFLSTKILSFKEF